MGRTTWIRTGLCLLAVLVLLCMGLVLAEENPAVSLRVNGEDSAVDLLLRESAAVEISAPGATAVRFMLSEDYWVELAEWGEWEEWSQSGEIRFDWDDWEGTVYAQACFDTDPSSEEAVWVRSNTVDVNLTTLGNLQAHTIEHADLVQRGELLEVRLSGLDENAEWTYVSVFNDEGDFFHQDRLGDQFYIPTAQFAPGTYNIGVGSRKVGYEDYWTADAFTVTEPENGGIVFAIDKTEVVTFEDFMISVYAPGADEVKLFEGEWEIDWRDCDTYVEHHSHGEATELHFHAEAHMPETDEWVSSESITVNVTAPYGDLAPFEIQGMPGQIAQLEAVSGVIMPVEGAQWYSLSFGINRGDDWEWFETHDQEVNNTTINYDGHWFDEVGVYRLNVGAHARGMSSSYAEAYIVVQPEEDKERVTLSIGGETEVLNCVANTQQPLVVIAPGA